MDAPKILKESEEKMRKSEEVVSREFSTIRTSRASNALVEDIEVQYYNTPMPLKQLATISTPEPRLIIIHPWDNSIIEEIEKAILKSDLGITPNNDGKVIRLGLPQLTKERREELVKVIKKIAEEGRISIRSIRRDANESIKILEKNGTVSEDEKFKFQDKIQKLTDKYIGDIDIILDRKEKEILEV